MRLLISLKSLNSCAYDVHYYNKLQGFVYSHLRNFYPKIHDKKSYKFFCFSNIFPIGDIKEGSARKLLISSPDNTLIKLLNENIPEKISVGEMLFEVTEKTLIESKLNFLPSRIISATPIIIRIPQRKYQEYGIESDKNYIYWRKTYPFNVFVKQLEENLIKKYNEFYKTDIEEFPIFEQFIFKKETCNHVFIKNKETKIIGSIWEFIFSNLNKYQEKILNFGLDCGLGERNSLGFGFMNLVRK